MSKNYPKHAEQSESNNIDDVCVYCLSAISPYGTGHSKLVAIRPCKQICFFLFHKTYLLRFCSGHCMHRQHYLCVLAALFKKRWLSRQRGTDHGEDGYGVFVSFRFACCQGTLVHSVHGGTTTYKLDPTVCSLFFFYTSIISIFQVFHISETE